MRYSQNYEQDIIEEYFDDYIGTALSIGENNGEHLSNVRALIDKGWSCTCVEPAPVAFGQLQELYALNERVYCINAAVSDYNGRAKFYDSGTHLNKGDTSLLSTLSEKETEKWAANTEFKTIEVDVIYFKELLRQSPYKRFDFISIDVEGLELVLLEQMDLKALECKLICVEWNSKDKDKFDEKILPQSYHLIHKNLENLIYAAK